MTNNDILRRLRFSFEFNNKQVKAIFNLADLNVNETLIEQWLKKDDDDTFIAINDLHCATFLNGFICHLRGKQEGKSRAPEKRLTNNIVLNKLKIALNLKAEDIIDMLSDVNFTLSKHELSAIFRKPDHKHFRECKDQLLRNFLSAIQLKYRKSPLPKAKEATTETTYDSKPSYKSKDSSERSNEVRTSYKGTKDKSNQDNKDQHQYDKTARPQASKPYINPKATKNDDAKAKRTVLKIKPSEIWKNS